jgi:predicted amidophosphoribosyltransferase
MINYCDECQKVIPSDELKRIHKQHGLRMLPEYVCPECYEKHEKELELTRQNFQAQFGEPEKPSKEAVKNATDETHHVVYERDSKPVDIHKIIDDAMEKKDRSVTIFIGKEATTVSVYPYDDKPREWITMDRNGGWFRCPECGSTYRDMSPYCPECGEKLKKNN